MLAVMSSSRSKPISWLSIYFLWSPTNVAQMISEMEIRNCKPTSKYLNTRPLALDANDPLRASAGEKDVM